MQAVEMEILGKWNTNFCSNRLERKNGKTSEDRAFIPENFLLFRALHLHFNPLSRKFWLNGKCTVRRVNCKRFDGFSRVRSRVLSISLLN